MKSWHQIGLTFAIATATGFGGYYFGKRHSENAGSPAAAQATVSSTPGSAVVDPSLKAPVVMKVDSKSLVAKLAAEKDPLKRYKLALENLEAWIHEAPEEALNWLRSQQPSARRDEILRVALGQYAEKNARAAVVWAEQNLVGVELNNNLIELCTHWAQQNGQAAADWFLARPATPQRDAAMESVFFAWGTGDPSAALAYAQGNPALAEMASTIRRAAFAGWAKSDPEAAAHASLSSSRSHHDPDQFANTLANWATVDLSASAAWLQANLPTGAERSAAIPELATIFAQQSPEAGAEWISQLQAGAERDGAANRFALGWAVNDAAAAARWIASQPEATFTAETQAGIAHQFLMADPASFAAWRASLPEGTLKAQANGVGAGQ